MRCVVTAGPTYEPLDPVRRLTNHSTGKLGTSLAAHLAGQGHEVVLLRGVMAVHRAAVPANCRVIEFATGADLARELEGFASTQVAALLHAAAVGDFTFGKVWREDGAGQRVQVASGKLSSAEGTLLAELQPTQKILAKLRSWFPNTLLVGWKYEVEGDRARAEAAGVRQIEVNQTDGCVVNGPAYGEGFGWLSKRAAPQHLKDAAQLNATLASWLLTSSRPSQSRAG